MMRELTLFALRKKNRARVPAFRKGSTAFASKAFSLIFAANELGGETGELQNRIKKYARGLLHMAGGDCSREQKNEIGYELADVIICADLVALEMDIDLDQIVQSKFNMTTLKHKLGDEHMFTEADETDLGEMRAVLRRITESSMHLRGAQRVYLESRDRFARGQIDEATKERDGAQVGKRAEILDRAIEAAQKVLDQ